MDEPTTKSTDLPLGKKVSGDNQRLLMLLSSTSGRQEQKTAQDRALTILKGMRIVGPPQLEQLDGADPTHLDRRNALFALSGIRGHYPQFFLVGAGGKVEFFADWEQFELLNDAGRLAQSMNLETETETETSSPLITPAVIPTQEDTVGRSSTVGDNEFHLMEQQPSSVVRSAKKTVTTTQQSHNTFSHSRTTMSNKNTKQSVQVGGLSPSFFDASSKAFLADPKNKLACNALTASDWEKVVGNNEEIRSINPSFSKKLLPDMKSTSQRQSGRCWLFAVLNVMRRDMVTKYNLNDDFELSQTYLFFYDKLEKCNYFLENIIQTFDEKMEDRLLSHLVDNPIEDGGQWDMVVNIVEKYGIVPKYVMPDVEPAKFTRRMNNFLLYQLRDYAQELRGLLQKGTSVDVVRARKEEMMETVYRILAIHLGEPPQTFDWKVHDKDKKFLSFPKQTPQQFYNSHVPTTVTDLVCIVNDPRHPYGCTMTVQMLGNVQEGRDVLYLNLSMEDVIQYAKKTIDNNQPVWFGCDVGAESNVKGQGLMSTELWDYNSVFGTTPHLSKADRLRYGQSLMTHAMVLTGYDEDSSPENEDKDKDKEKVDEPSQWRVENSWGDDGC